MTGLDIGVDVDEPLFPWYERAHEASIKFGLTDGTIMPQTWAPHEEYGCSLEDWWAALADAIDWMYDAPPQPGSREAIERLMFAGHRVHLITARGTRGSPLCQVIQQHTWNWVLDYDLPIASLTFSKDKTIVHTDYFVDDNVDNWQALTAAGTRAYLLNAPWNAEQDTPFRVNSVREFADIILEGDFA